MPPELKGSGQAADLCGGAAGASKGPVVRAVDEREPQLLQEVAFLRRCVQYLERENEMLSQQLERRLLADAYRGSIEAIVRASGHDSDLI